MMRRSSFSGLFVLALLTGCGGSPAEPPAKPLSAVAPPRQPQAFPSDVWAAWEKAGGKIGWNKVDGKELPWISFIGWKGTSIQDLPAPDAPFGLDFTGSGVTDANLNGLAKLGNLQVLNLQRAKVTDATLKELAGLTKLESLDAREIKATDAGVKNLSGLSALRELKLSGIPVTDEGIKALAGLTKLQTLELTGLKKLRSVNVESTDVTDVGVGELKKALPECKAELPLRFRMKSKK